MAAGSRANAARVEAGRSSSGKGSIGTSISNRPGTESHRWWTFLNLGKDPGPGTEGEETEKK